MKWLENSKKNLLPLSYENENFEKALSEWFYSDNYQDHGSADEVCELCEHTNLRFKFEIININTQHNLFVGSECIKKFEIISMNEEGELLSVAETRSKIDKDRRNIILDAKKRRQTNCLFSLLRVENLFDIDSFMEYLHDRQAFTPMQMFTLLWRLEQHKIAFEKSDFKVVIRRDREKKQLLEMETWKVQKIWKVLSQSQKEWYNGNKKK